MSRLYDILMDLVGTSETLATGATLYRNGKKRKLVLSGYKKTSTNLTVPSADLPSVAINTVGLRRDSNGRSTALGVAALSTSGTVSLYYAGTYNSASAGLSSLAVNDTMEATLEWVVEGGGS